MEVEHSNKFVKASIKSLGPNIIEKAVKRISQAENRVRSMADNFDNGLRCVHGYGRRTSSSTKKDLEELVNLLSTQRNLGDVVNISNTSKGTVLTLCVCHLCTSG